MKTIIAEKPSVAREIAYLLGASEKKDGYLTGNGYFVTWAFGHLIGLGMPEDYGISGFDKTTLPILPNPFLLTVRKVKKDKGYSINNFLQAKNPCINTSAKKPPFYKYSIPYN